MPEVNEEIVRQYLELQGFFVRTGARYFRSKTVTGKRGSGYGDLDLLAQHPDGRRYLIEVKGWHMGNFIPSHFVKGEPYVDRVEKKEASRLFGGKPFETVLVVSAITDESRAEVERLARREGIDHLWVFNDILSFLAKSVAIEPSYPNEVLQTIRLLKTYGFLTSAKGVAKVRRPSHSPEPRQPKDST